MHDSGDKESCGACRRPPTGPRHLSAGTPVPGPPWMTFFPAASSFISGKSKLPKQLSRTERVSFFLVLTWPRPFWSGPAGLPRTPTAESGWRKAPQGGAWYSASGRHSCLVRRVPQQGPWPAATASPTKSDTGVETRGPL